LVPGATTRAPPPSTEKTEFGTVSKVVWPGRRHVGEEVEAARLAAGLVDLLHRRGLVGQLLEADHAQRRDHVRQRRPDEHRHRAQQPRH